MATVSVETDVLTLPEAAHFLRVKEEAVVRMVATQGLQARHLGGNDWRFTKAELDDWLNHRSPKARMLSTAGALKDDPFFDDMMKIMAENREKARDEGI